MVRRNRRLWLGGVGIAAVVVVFAARPQAQEKSETAAPRVLQAPMRAFMDAKLTGAQSAFQGLLTRDFVRVRGAAESLLDMALTAPPTEMKEDLDGEVYEHFRTEFTRLSGKLVTMAREENFEGAAWVHQNLTATCIACHEYVRDRRHGVVPATAPVGIGGLR